MHPRRWLFLIALFLIAGPGAGDAGQPPSLAPDKSALPEGTAEKTAARRGARWYNRPAADNAAAQLVTARTLEQAGSFLRARRAYLALVYAWPDAPEAPRAQLALARVLERQQKDSAAFDEYQYLIDRYAGQFVYEEAIASQFALALRLKTKERYEAVVRNAPRSGQAAEAQYRAARLAEDARDYPEAIADYQIIQSRYPAGPWAEDAAFRETVCLYELCVRSTPQDELSHLNARAALARFMRSYPDGANSTLARTYLQELEQRLATLAYQRAWFYDRQVQPPRPQAAVLAYRDFLKRCPTAGLAETARLRLAELEQSMEKQNHAVSK